MKCERLYDTVIVSRGWRSVLCVQTPVAHFCAIFLLSSWATNQLTSGNPTLISCAEPVHVLAGRDYESFFFNFIVECFVWVEVCGSPC